MNVKNCRSCGKIFNYIGGMPICPTCREAADKKFQEVKDYIREHKGCSIPEVSELDLNPQNARCLIVLDCRRRVE